MGSCQSIAGESRHRQDERNEKMRRLNTTSRSMCSEDKLILNDLYGVTKNVLGKGADAIVYEGYAVDTFRKVAVKVVNLDDLKYATKRELILTGLRREGKILASLNHKSVMKLYDYSEEGSIYTMVLECAFGGSLFEKLMKLKKFPEDDARVLFYHLAESVKYIHSKNIVHRDLKPENILLKSLSYDEILLCDFGYAIECKDASLTDQLGTPNYVAPEILLRHPYGKTADVWALGVILFIMLSGNFPFNNPDHTALFKSIIRGQYSFDIDKEKWEGVSEAAKELIKKILVVDETKRVIVEDILSDPWLARCRAVAPSSVFDLSEVDSPEANNQTSILSFIFDMDKSKTRGPSTAVHRQIKDAWVVL